jgi:hypothetical protein
MPAYRSLVACLMVTTLSACTSSDELMQRFTYRWGPNPSLPASNVSTAIADEVGALNYITTTAFETPYPNIPSQFAGRPDVYWYYVAEWGLNVGRRDCEIYMDYMFRLNREKQRSDSIISGLGAFASGLVTATSKSATTLSILAASFGLATAVNDAIFTSYLFSEAPGLISIKVKALQDNYQQQIEKNQQPQMASNHAVSSVVATTKITGTTNTASAATPTPPKSNATDTTTTVVLPIISPHQAYSAIQNYYHLCLPQAIEGVLLQAVADSTATSTSPSNSSTPKLSGTAGK